MLHELLVALSGHDSPFFSDVDGDKYDRFVSHSERSLLKSLAGLGSLQTDVRKRCKEISTSHASPVCRAVTSFVFDGPLSSFQDKCVQIESDILQQNPDVVGAYDIVPLSGIVRAFDGWQRKLEWLSNLLLIIEGTGDIEARETRDPHTSGAKTIDFLRNEIYTGYPDIEEISLNLLKAAETAWIRQAASWLLYGTLPNYGQEDFFIQIHSSSSADNPGGEIRKSLMPGFIDQDTAYSMLFIGKSLRHIRRNAATLLADDLDGFEAIRSSLLSEHTMMLARLQCPIQTFALNKTIASMRSSMSRNALQKLLPMSEIIHTLDILREFMLLERGEFSVALIDAADDYLINRYSQTPNLKGKTRLGGMMIKEPEMNIILATAWSTLSALQDANDDSEDEVLESARRKIKFSVSRSASTETVPTGNVENNIRNIFSDVLLAVPGLLNINVIPPQDLFLAKRDVEVYSRINSYLLSIRRAGTHLSQLWKISILRKAHPISALALSTEVSKARERRDGSMRATWTMISNVHFFFNQLGNYLQGEVVKGCTDGLHKWLNLKSSLPCKSTTNSRLDPESVTAAHRMYLSHLTYVLLLDDARYVTGLRNLMTRVDHMVALVSRLAAIAQALQLEEPIPPNSNISGYHAQEESDLFESMASVRKSMKLGLDELIKRLGEIDEERSRASLSSYERYISSTNLQSQSSFSNAATFTPWKGASLASLLLRLEPGGTRY